MDKDIRYIHTKIKQVFGVKPNKDTYSPTGYYQSFSDKDLYCNLEVRGQVATIRLNKANKEKFEFIVGVGNKWTKSDCHLLKQHKEALIKRAEQSQSIDYYRPKMPIYE
ncbi:MAG: hypothetical protein V4687_16160 [Bacteroidota bacterium]